MRLLDSFRAFGGRCLTRDEREPLLGKVKKAERRKEAALGVVVLCASAAPIYAAYAQDGPVAYAMSTPPPGFSVFQGPGIPCDGTVPAEARQMGQTARFAQEMGGSCCNYTGSATLQEGGQSFTEYSVQTVQVSAA